MLAFKYLGLSGGRAAESLQVGGAAVGYESGLVIAHILMKLVLRVSTPRVLLASVLSKAG